MNAAATGTNRTNAHLRIVADAAAGTPGIRISGVSKTYRARDGDFRTFLEGLRSSPPEVDDLQTAFDVELTALNVVQALYAGIVVVLVIGIVVN